MDKTQKTLVLIEFSNFCDVLLLAESNGAQTTWPIAIKLAMADLHYICPVILILV